MDSEELKPKRVIVHVGPHKTGSTAIQAWLGNNREYLSENDILFIHTKETHQIARLLIRENYIDAATRLRELASKISGLNKETIILSQEDFAGDLPGRSKKRSIYSRLLKNLRIIQRALEPHDVTFVFFERSEIDWMKSCYHQNLVMRTTFSSFPEFLAFFRDLPTWNEVLQKAVSSLKTSLKIVPYSRSSEEGVIALLAIAGIECPILPSPPSYLNSSPQAEIVAVLERVNALSAFPNTAWFTKELLLSGWTPQKRRVHTSFDFTKDDRSAALALPELLERVKQRFPAQDVEDLLPDDAVELKPLAYEILPSEIELPTVSRARMSDQSRLLDYHFRGKSHLAKLNALLISYLRRNTNLTDRARKLFHRVWRECGILLINELSTRWLISTLQTFLDYGETEAQRAIGNCGYFYANLLKIYEGERSIEGLNQDGILSGTEPRTPGRFLGLDRYRVGNTDLLLNVNALALEISLRDDVAGIILQEFLLRVKNSGNAFTRSDATRLHYGISIEGFKDVWSFYKPP